jgi:cytochrome c-type biogenesis protein CcmH
MRELLKIPLLLVGMLVGLLVLSIPANAVIETYEFGDPELRERYHRFTDELRCPKCQNQNLSGSNSPIAKDLRRELHRLLQEGRDDQQVIDYMVGRYGEFILYRPQFNKQTAVLWMAPALFAVLGLVALVLIFIKQRKKALPQGGDQEVALDSREQQALNELLNDTMNQSDNTNSTEVSNRG